MMHIPDGWLDLGVLLLAWSITLITLSISVSKIKTQLDKISNIGAIASVIFVAQMFNFPIVGGTTGHLLGGALAVYVVGLPGAIVAMFSVLFVQAFVFADGGIIALGVNMLNMGIVTSLVAYTIKNISTRDNISNLEYYSRVFLSAFLSVSIASIFATFELIFSNKATLSAALPLVLGYHVIIGFFEGILTVGIIYYLKVSEFPIESQTIIPEKSSLLETLKSTNKGLFGFGFLLLFLSGLSLFAFPGPDGLESASQQLGIGGGSYFTLNIANDYDFMGLGSVLGTILSAFLGILLIVGFYFIPASFFGNKNKLSKV